jgi:hypothetical protein
LTRSHTDQHARREAFEGRGWTPAEPVSLPCWTDIAPSLLAPRLRGATDRLARLEGKVELARTLLSTVAARGPRARFAVDRASDRLDEVHLAAALARALLPLEAAWPEIAARAATARREVIELRPVLFQMHEALGRLARRAPAVRPTPGEIGDLDRAAQETTEALGLLEATAEVLLELDGGAAPGALSASDARALGLAFSPPALPPQTLWTEANVEALSRRCAGLGRLRGPSRAPAGADGVGSVCGADVLAALKESGVELAVVDPGQLRPAAAYVSAAPTLARRQERLARAVEVFRLLGRVERRVWPRQKMEAELQRLTGVPSRALSRLPDTEVLERFRETARAVNCGPGPAYLRIGPYEVTLEADGAGRVLRSRRRGPLARGTRALGRTLPLALTALRHYRATRPLGRLLTWTLHTGGAVERRVLAGLARVGAALLGTAARSGRPLPEGLGRASRVLRDLAVLSAARRAYRAAGRAGAEARRAMAAARSCSDPAAFARARKRLQQAEEARQGVLRSCAAGLLQASPTASWPRVHAAPSGPLAPPPNALPKTGKPSTTGTSLRSLMLQLRRSRTLVEQVQETARELNELKRRSDLPGPTREAAAAAALAIERALATFERELRAAEGEAATDAARLAFERRVTELLAQCQRIPSWTG